MFGCGAVAQLVLSGGTHGMFLTVNFAFGFAATLGILVCGQVSGKQSIYLFIKFYYVFMAGVSIYNSQKNTFDVFFVFNSLQLLEYIEIML